MKQGTHFSPPCNRVHLRDRLPPGVYDSMAPSDRKKLAAQLNCREDERETSLPAYRGVRVVVPPPSHPVRRRPYARRGARSQSRGRRRARQATRTRAGPDDGPPPSADPDAPVGAP